ncbi:MAG TPA: hypothetical protein VFB19_18620 [Mycobacterium sp.]|nr:hypothetical protein [Mycobacterium sp.]
MALIQLGNVAPHEGEVGLYHSHFIGGQEEHHHSYGELHAVGRRRTGLDDVTTVRQLPRESSHTTTLILPDAVDLDVWLSKDLPSLWPHHSLEAPGFVLCDDADLKRAIEKQFGIKPIKGPTALYTNAGRDYVSTQLWGNLKYVALTANTTPPSAGDTTLTAEITTASGGLIRAAGTPAHTTGASTTTITITHTANGSDLLPVTIGKEGLFTAATSGTMGFETLLGTTATLSAVGDALTSTWTITHG